VRQVRAHDPVSGDLPARFEATIAVDKPTEGDPVMLSEYRDLLVAAINQLNIPPTARLLEGATLALRWP
jgi:hypothetical protein